MSLENIAKTIVENFPDEASEIRHWYSVNEDQVMEYDCGEETPELIEELPILWSFFNQILNSEKMTEEISAQLFWLGFIDDRDSMLVACEVHYRFFWASFLNLT
jgi:hypothetical protein